MRKALGLSTVFFASLTLVSCGRSESPVSTVKSSRGFSCDLQSSAAATSDASKRAFKCAYNSLKSAGKLAGGGIVSDVANVVDGVKNVYEGSTAAYELFQDLNEFVNNGGQQPGAFQDSAQDFQTPFDSSKSLFEKTEFGQEVKRKAMYRCLDGSYRAVKDLVSLAEMSSNLGGGYSGSILTVSEIQSLGTVGYTSIKALLERMQTVSECSQWLSGSRTKSLVQLSKGVTKITTSLEVITTLGRCGVDLAYGGYVLANNSACLVEDIKNYYQTREREELAKNKYINDLPGDFEPLSKEDGRVEGNDGSYARCSVIYGMWLADQTYYSYFTRSSVCADQCASSKGQQTYYENLRNIFPRSDDYGYCSMNQKIPGSQIQAEACISYCCSGEGSCVRAANRKAGYQ
jgi:hypothetical protein